MRNKKKLAKALDEAFWVGYNVGWDARHEPTECPEEHLTHSEDTLFKVQAAIMSCDLGEDDVRDVINAMHNAGILFRERSD